jgi:chaperone modulatory protein CbpM
MNTIDMTTFSGVVVDEATLTIDELACACSVETTWIVQRVYDGLLTCENPPATTDESNWRFASGALIRARRLANIERTFDANAEVSALVVDLLEEVSALRNQLTAAKQKAQ